MAVAATSPAKGVVDVAYVACEGVAFYIHVPLKSAQLAHYSILLSPILKLRNPDLGMFRSAGCYNERGFGVRQRGGFGRIRGAVLLGNSTVELWEYDVPEPRLGRRWCG